jgi:hypothetical protein
VRLELIGPPVVVEALIHKRVACMCSVCVCEWMCAGNGNAGSDCLLTAGRLLMDSTTRVCAGRVASLAPAHPLLQPAVDVVGSNCRLLCTRIAAEPCSTTLTHDGPRLKHRLLRLEHLWDVRGWQPAMAGGDTSTR